MSTGDFLNDEVVRGSVQVAVVMGEGVIGDFMPFRDHPFDQFGVGGSFRPHNKESGLQATLLERVENLRGPGTRAVVKREGDIPPFSWNISIEVLGRSPAGDPWKRLDGRLRPRSFGGHFPRKSRSQGIGREQSTLCQAT